MIQIPRYNPLLLSKRKDRVPRCRDSQMLSSLRQTKGLVRDIINTMFTFCPKRKDEKVCHITERVLIYSREKSHGFVVSPGFSHCDLYQNSKPLVFMYFDLSILRSIFACPRSFI